MPGVLRNVRNGKRTNSGLMWSEVEAGICSVRVKGFGFQVKRFGKASIHDGIRILVIWD